MLASHVSMRDDFEIVPPELDELANVVRPLSRGARMTGGGFGGCVIALADDDDVDAVRAAAEAWGATVYVCRASDGVRTEPTGSAPTSETPS
jgi:galactokinase